MTILGNTPCVLLWLEGVIRRESWGVVRKLGALTPYRSRVYKTPWPHFYVFILDSFTLSFQAKKTSLVPQVCPLYTVDSQRTAFTHGLWSLDLALVGF